jgi:hypothetical protein
MHKSSRKSAKLFQEKDATLIAEKVCVLEQLVGGWWEEKVDFTPCNGATPSESRIREICTWGSMTAEDLLLLYGLGRNIKFSLVISRGLPMPNRDNIVGAISERIPLGLSLTFLYSFAT